MARELDVRVATLLGWTPRRTAGRNDCLWLMCPPGSSGPPENIPWFRTDMTAARAMEDWIEEHGSRLRYAQAVMAGFLYTDPLPDTDEALWWALLHATPEQRCRAFLAAMDK